MPRRDPSLARGKPGPRGALPDHYLVWGRKVQHGATIEVMFPTGWQRGHLSIRRDGRHEIAAFFDYDGGSVQLWPGRSAVRLPGEG